MKKIFALIIAVTLIVTYALSVSAAGGITADEQKIIDALSKKITMASGSITKLDDKYINKAEDYLTKADLSSVEVETILTNIDAAAEVLKKSESKTFKELSDTEKNSIVTEAQKAAQVINADLSVVKGDTADSYKVNLVFNSNSTVPGYTAADNVSIPVSGSIIKQTGAEGNFTAVIVGATVMMLGLAFVVISARKKASER